MMNHVLKGIAKTNKEFQNNNELLNNKLYQAHIQTTLKKCIRHHQFLLR
nr:unnamed protein product [Callosobruchus analis]